MNLHKINLKAKFALIKNYWTPYIIGELNGQYIKLAKLKGEFVWHAHDQEDEFFQVIKGVLIIEFRDQQIRLEEGEMIIVPKGVEHNPHTLNDEECWVMLFEPISTLHTGEVIDSRTQNDQRWI
jgi:mannose-6-phosphate isomerase-like protein (cupin superfamily)